MAKLKVPTVNDLVKLTTDQIEALSQLPSSIVLLNQTLTGFAQTVGRLDKLVKRMDRLTEPLEEPLAALAPRLEALIPLLDEELMSSLPEVLDSVRRNAIPALEVFGQTQAQVASIAQSVDRLMHLMDDTLLRLQDLPGVGLVNRLRGGATTSEKQTSSTGRSRAASKTTKKASAEPAPPLSPKPGLPAPRTGVEETRSWRG